MLGSFVGKIQKGLSLFAHRRSTGETSTIVPEDVKEGHFAVLAIMGEESRRFIIELEYLADPVFMALLDRAVEEYGFSQKGALAVPCFPHELQQILDNRKADSINHILSYSKTSFTQQ